jgi:hypothetical protein
MTDFFESLAARARGEGLAVRPRLPGLFEPTPHDPSDLTVVSDITDSPPATAARPAPIASPAPAPRPAPIPPSPAATTPTAGVADRETARAPPRPAVASAHPPLELPIAQTPPRAAPPIQTLGATLPPHHDDRPQAVANRPAPLPRPIVDPESARVRRAVEADAPSSALAPRLSPRPSMADAVPPGSARSRPPQSAPRQAMSPPETTIHVSIGRIEVRAAQPAQDSKPREPAKPAVQSLDEYLRARRERR